MPLVISMTKTRHGWECATVEYGRRIHMTYQGYTKKEARSLFRQHVLNLKD